MPSPPGREGAVEHAWQRQGVWSQAANRLKRGIEQRRLAALALTLLGAVLSAAAVVAGLDTGLGKVSAFVAAVSVGLGGLARAGTGTQAVREWTRARSVSEAIKSEVFLYLTRSGGARDVRGEAALDNRVQAIEDDAADLLAHTAGVTAENRPPPAVDGLDSYLRVRVSGQLDGFYRPRAGELQAKLTRVRWAEGVLGVVGAVLAAAAGLSEDDSVAVWVPVVTTITAAVTAHAAAARYEYLLVEYLRTALQLERLRDRRGDAATMTDEQLIRAAEHVISVQNQGWMAKLTSQEEAPAAG
ncbi:MAG TPA: DUF4231 domain-containing protein [Thermoleophilaceae bacterium]|nr:DUF4231 domain-containing protein [Thermoleophilaceae bacterium]